MDLEKLYESFKEILNDQSTVEHIFIGEINRRGLAVGFHHEGEFAKELSKVIESTRSQEDDVGVYEANVIIRGVEKLTLSSFFPKNISPKDVLQMLKDAYNNKVKIKSFLYEAILTNGMIIHFYENDNSGFGKITTAYPKYQKMEMI